MDIRESVICLMFGIWDMALEYINKSSSSAHPILAFREGDEILQILTNRATDCAASSPLRRRLQNFVPFSGLVSVSSPPISRLNDSKIHGKATEQKNRQT
jgi:hypothetical protein